MAALSDFAENKIIDWLFRAQAIGITGASAAAGTGPANLYVALFTVTPTDSTGGTEVTGGNYARQTVVSGLTTWNGTHGNTTGASSGSTGTTSNANAVVFPVPSASAYSGVVNGVGVFDAITAGNLLFYSALGTPKTVNQNDAAPSFVAGALTFQIDN